MSSCDAPLLRRAKYGLTYRSSTTVWMNEDTMLLSWITFERKTTESAKLRLCSFSTFGMRQNVFSVSMEQSSSERYWQMAIMSKRTTASRVEYIPLGRCTSTGIVPKGEKYAISGELGKLGWWINFTLHSARAMSKAWVLVDRDVPKISMVPRLSGLKV